MGNAIQSYPYEGQKVLTQTSEELSCLFSTNLILTIATIEFLNPSQKEKERKQQKITYTPYLIGFPVDGSRSIICEDINTKQICIYMLGTYEEKPKMKMKVSKRWLKDTFEAVSEDISEDAIAPYVRGYLLYHIGTKVLPNYDKPTYYSVYWLQFLEDLSPSKLNDVAWGAAALAMLHTSLGSDGRKNFFLLERIPNIANLIMGIGSSEEKTVPLFRYWSPRMVSPGKDSGKPEMKQFEFISITLNSGSPRGELGLLGLTTQSNGPTRLNSGQTRRNRANRVKHSLRGCQKRKLKDPYLPYIEVWKNRHLEMNCIKDDRPCFLLPSVHAENDSDGPQSNQQNDLDGPQSNQQNYPEGFYNSEGQQTAENDSDIP
nr:serine/threonine-protein phosphatase 7 long form homolog [Tanacetum cinerariifolium]